MRCCSAATSGSGSRTTCTTRTGSWRPTSACRAHGPHCSRTRLRARHCRRGAATDGLRPCDDYSSSMPDRPVFTWRTCSSGRRRTHEAPGVRSIAVIGTGSVGPSWAALFLARGIDVIAYDPRGPAELRTRLIVRAWPALSSFIAGGSGPPLHRMPSSPRRQAAEAADWCRKHARAAALKAAVLAETRRRRVPREDHPFEHRRPAAFAASGRTRASGAAGRAAPVQSVAPHRPGRSSRGPEDGAGRGEWAIDFARYLGKQPIRLNVEAPAI